MSFLAGRLASTEGAYFLQESKHAVSRLIEKNKKNTNNNFPSSSSSSSSSLNSSSVSVMEDEAQADVLPEVLRHSLPSKIFEPLADSSLSTASKWDLPHDVIKVHSLSTEALNPLRSYLSLPQVTFGPKRWQLPEGENSFLASTANDLRHDRYTNVNPEKLKAAAEGLSQIGTSFAIATVVVFGGAALTFGLIASKLDLQTSDDIRSKGRDILQPKIEGVRGQLVPIRVWAENATKQWRIEREKEVKENPLIKELTKRLGVRNSS